MNANFSCRDAAKNMTEQPLRKRFPLLGLCACFTLFIGAAQASALLDAFTPVRDPLLTRPAILDLGSILPGDHVFLACPGFIAEQLTQQTLSLVDVLNIGLCTNPQVQGAWAAIKVQAAAVGEARAAYLPTLSLGLSRLDDRTSYPGSNAESATVRGNSKSMALNWRLFDFGARAANRAAATALLEAALASHNAVLQKTLETLIGAFFDTQTAAATWVAKQKNAELARSTWETAQRRESRGAGAQSDTLQARTALARASLDNSRAQGEYQKAMALLVYALGVAPGTVLHLASDLEDRHHSMEQDLQLWLEQAERAHPAILAAQAQLEAANQKLVSTQSEGLPTLDLGANLYRNGRPSQGLSVVQSTEKVIAVTLNIPLFEGFARTYKVRGAQAQAEQQQANLDDMTHQVLMNIVKTYSDAQSGLGNLDDSEMLLQSAEMALDSVQRKFDRGAADILEILSTQAALADAQQQRIRCLAEWRSARLRLMASAGQLGLEQFSHDGTAVLTLDGLLSPASKN